MLSFIKSKFMGEAGSKQAKGGSDEANGRTLNPINELQILEGHTDIVRHLLKVDEMRIASGADDGLIILWNRMTGEKVLTLKGHTLPITCMLLIERYKLVSGSADKTIRIWDLKTGVCNKVIKAHEGSVKCIVPLPGKFCSGSNDRYLCIWKNDGELVQKIERREEENIQCLLPITMSRLITSSNSSLLLVYKLDSPKNKVQILAYHRESVRCLVRVSATHFASGSMDGCVVIWQSDTLAPVKVLNNPEKYRNEDKVYIYNIKYLLSLGEKFLAAAIGNGFKIYDVETEECVLDCSVKHDAEVNSLISLYDGTRIVSCAADASIKIWTTAQKLNLRKKKDLKDDDKGGKAKRTGKLDPILLGEMWGHSDCVNSLLGFTENSFASCGSDGNVILWKDGRVEAELRNIFAAAVIQHQNSEFEDDDMMDERRSSIDFSSPAPRKKRVDLSTADDEIDNQDWNSVETFDSGISEQEESPVTVDAVLQATQQNQQQQQQVSDEVRRSSISTRVPEYIFDYAEHLRKEKKLPLNEISSKLRQLGHSESLVMAVYLKQQELSEPLMET